MGCLAAPLVFSVVTWMLLAIETTVSSPVVEPRPLRPAAVASDAGIDVVELPSMRLDTHKRRWGRNNVAVWGKRSAGDLDAAKAADLEKRRWGQNSMALWGKRSNDDDDERWDASPQLTKRRWGQKHMSMWGKRADAGLLQYDADQLEATKRKWGQKNMALWG